MNFRKLLTYFAFGTAAVMPFATAQNPTILQGSYISNVFGPSNFVLNPNAQTNIANVTVSSATVARATTTPLVATSEFTITTSTSTGYADWALRTFDSGMKNNNCEARFTYRGFTVGSTKAQILQGTNVVAELTLVGDANNPKIASINFPCGDLLSVTKFRLQQATASLTGTNEIGGIYVGLATNQANVAQAEFVGSLTWPLSGQNAAISNTAFAAFGTIGSTNPTILGDVNFSTTAPKITINNMKAGNYRIVVSGMFMCFSATLTDAYCGIRLTDGTTVYGSEVGIRGLGAISGNQGAGVPNVTFEFQYTGPTTSKTFQLEGSSGSASSSVRVETNAVVNRLQISVYRFPSSSELVVKPETQNVFGAIDGTGVDSTTTSGSYVTPSGFTVSSGRGKCLADGTNLACKISTLPPGTYKVDVSLPYFAVAGSAGQTCYVQITDNKGAIDAATAQASTAGGSQQDGISSLSRTFTYSSVQTDIIFSLKHKQISGTGGSCGLYTASGPRYWQMNVTPLDQPSNSALYVQGPVLGAQTGAAIPAGYAGYTIESTQTGTTTPTNSNTWYTSESVTLTPGVWSCNANAAFYYTSVPTGFNAWDFGICTGTNCAPTQPTGIHGSNVAATRDGGVSYGSTLNNNKIITVTSSTTYNLSSRFIFTARNSLVIDNNESYLRCTLLN